MFLMISCGITTNNADIKIYDGKYFVTLENGDQYSSDDTCIWCTYPDGDYVNPSLTNNLNDLIKNTEIENLKK